MGEMNPQQEHFDTILDVYFPAFSRIMAECDQDFEEHHVDAFSDLLERLSLEFLDEYSIHECTVKFQEPGSVEVHRVEAATEKHAVIIAALDSESHLSLLEALEFGVVSVVLEEKDDNSR